jgi:hypothetical protein
MHGAKVGRLIPTLDIALSALLDDLDERGRLKETLVVVMGEFGRTPKINTPGAATTGRGSSACSWRAEASRGQVLGASDSQGRAPPTDPSRPPTSPARSIGSWGVDPPTN